MATQAGPLQDPQGLWDGNKSMPDGRPAGRFASEAASELNQRFVAGPKSLEKEIQMLAQTLARPGLTLAERSLARSALIEAKKARRDGLKDNAEYTKILKSDKRYRNEAQRKLNLLMEHRRNTPKMTKKHRESLAVIEKHLKSILENSDEIGTSEEATLEVLKALDSVETGTSKLPSKLRAKFKDADKRTRAILEAQEEARKIVQQQNAWMMSIADKIGKGPLTLGNMIRLPGAIGSGIASLRSGASNINKHIQARRVMWEAGRTTKADYNDEAGTREAIEMNETLKESVAEQKRFNRRALFSLGRKSNDNDSGSGVMALGAAVAAAVTAFLGKLDITSILKNLLKLKDIPLPSRLPVPPGAALPSIAAGSGVAATVGAIALPAAAAAALAIMSKEQKERIEADPNAPEFKDNPYAMHLRGEATSVKQAGVQNQRKALKTLRPGEAKQYLEQGIQSDGRYLDGYTKEQLEAMAAGKPAPVAKPAGQPATSSEGMSPNAAPAPAEQATPAGSPAARGPLEAPGSANAVQASSSVSDASEVVQPKTAAPVTSSDVARRSGGSAGNPPPSVATIPVFDQSDGMFLALNAGII